MLNIGPGLASELFVMSQITLVGLPPQLWSNDGGLNVFPESEQKKTWLTEARYKPKQEEKQHVLTETILYIIL